MTGTTRSGQDVFTVTPGTSPLVVSFPHSGTHVPDEIAARMTDEARTLPDTDWDVPTLYDFTDALGAARIEAHASRYVVDLNRDPAGASLYPGRATTELVPTVQFDGSPIHLEGQAPDDDEIAARRARWFGPYHDALIALLSATVDRHGFAVLWDAHSIRSRVPRLFEGVLPDLNLGTWEGRSCAPEVQLAAATAMSDGPFSTVVNGRFTGGWITRSYGSGDGPVHALQMEIALSAYMIEEAPWSLDEARADRLRPVLEQTMTAALEAAAQLKRRGPR